jgi:hypothetical protein
MVVALVWLVMAAVVLADPETGRRQRVHMNPATGARVYVDEPAPPPWGTGGQA